MGQYFGQYVKALAVTVVAMVLYCLTVVPWIEPPEQKAYEIPAGPNTSDVGRWWQRLFSANDWQLQEPTVVHNSRGVLLARDWEQVSPASWKLTPLTIILADNPTDESIDDDTGVQSVWVVSAQQATIHFEKPFDLRSGTMPSVQKGQLDGEIVISRVNTTAPSERPWQLRTRDVSIDRRRIWTPQEVLIEFDNSRVRGHDLRINLLSDILSKRSGEGDDWADRYGPLEEIELMHLTELSIALKPGGIWANVNPDMLQLNQRATNLPARVEATCGGRFTFNFSKEMASLNGGVHLKHYLGGLQPDEFLCHRMNLRLQSPSDDNPDPKNNSLSGITVRSIDAFGVDSLEEFVGEKWVELRTPLAGATAQAKRMHYDFLDQRIELHGKLDQPGATLSVAELNYRGYKFRAQSLEYKAAPRGLDGRAEHAGWMAAEGSGEMSSPPESQIGEIHVRWQDRFTWAPSDIPGEQRIELLGQTLVEQKQQGFLAADMLEIWLASTPHADRLAASLSSKDNLGMSGMQPKRIRSRGKSVIATNRAQVNVQTLDVTLAYPPITEINLPKQATTGTKNPLGRFVGQPEAAKPVAGQTQQPIVINGQTLAATVASVGKRLWIDAMTIHGPLSLKSPSNQEDARWEVNGTAINLASSPTGDLDVEIEGQPATIHVADGSIQGPRIGFNQQQNRIWMDQPGEFTLPTDLKSAGSNVRWIKPLQCTWNKRMVFDGNRISFEGDIVLKGTVQQSDGFWFLSGTCQELDLQMAQPITLGQLGNLQQIDQKSQLQQIVLRENVELLASHKDNQGNLLSRGRLKLPTSLTVHVQDEKIVAEGPGRGYSNFVSNRAPGSLTGPGSLTSGPSGGSLLDSVGLTFRDSLVVFMERREVVIDGNVKILMSPIQNWGDELNPDDTVRLGEGQFSCISDQVRLYDTGGLTSTQSMLAMQGSSYGSSQWETKATGNVRFDGNTESGEYTGNAYEIVFVQSKNLLRVAGDGRSKAVIKKLPTFKNGQPEPSTTLKMNSGVFNVKNRGMLDSKGIEIHHENPDLPGQTQAPGPFPNRPGMNQPGMNQPGMNQPGTNPAIPPALNQPPIDPRERSINGLLRGYGT